MSFVSFVSSVVKSLQCSPGLYRPLVGQDEASDEQMLDERTTTTWLLDLLSVRAYHLVPANDALPELLSAIGSGDIGEVAALLSALGVTPGAFMPGPSG